MSPPGRIAITLMMLAVTACMRHGPKSTNAARVPSPIDYVAACTRSEQDTAVSKLAGLSFTMGGDTLVTLGDVLHVWLHVRNQTDRTLCLPLGGGLHSAFNPVVEDQSGQMIWDRVHGTPITLEQTTILLPPHGERAFTTAWGLVDRARNPVSPGRYVVRGRLLLAVLGAGKSFVDADNSPLNVVVRPKK